MKTNLTYTLPDIPFPFANKEYYTKVKSVKQNNSVPPLQYKTLTEYKLTRTAYRVRMQIDEIFRFKELLQKSIYNKLLEARI